MPSWFSKVFSGGAAKATPISKPAPAPIARVRPLKSESEKSESEAPKPADKPKRTVVHAPIIADDPSETAGHGGELRIKARVESGDQSCVFLVGRPVLEGYSIWIPTRETASDSPLAESLFEVDGVTSVLIHNFTVTVNRSPLVRGDWKPMAAAIGQRIREHLLANKPVAAESFFADMPGQDAIQEKIERVIQTEINPGIAAHSGAITLSRIEGNTVYIEMMGGCQGCAASDITLRQGIHQAFRAAVPQIGAILDTTDHAAGVNPYFTELPVGM